MKNESIGNTSTTNWEIIASLTDNQIIHDSDSPSTSESDWNNAIVCHSAKELHSETTRRIRGKNKRPLKKQVAIRFDSDIIQAFRATGKGWQTRMNNALKEWLLEHQAI